MKKIVFLLIVIQSILLLNCKKESAPDASGPPQLSDQLTNDTLKFELYIFNWKKTTERIFYKRGDSFNRINLDTAWFKFDKNGTYKAYISRDYNYSASWQFQENGAKLRLWSKDKHFDQKLTLLKLSKDTVEWIEPDTDSLFTRFIHK